MMGSFKSELPWRTCALRDKGMMAILDEETVTGPMFFSPSQENHFEQ